METVVNIREAKTNLSRLLSKVVSGETVIIAKAGKPIARIIPIGGAPKRRTPGSAKGKIVMGEDFLAPLPDDILDDFEK